MRDITPTQTEVLTFLKERAETGPLPTLREIRDRFDWSSHTAARHHLQALEKKGFIKRKTALARSIEVVWKQE